MSGASASAQAAYDPPSWSAAPTVAFGLEVLKSGIVVEEVPITTKPFYICGVYADSMPAPR